MNESINNMIIREARKEDAVRIAQAVAMAIGDEQSLQQYCGEDYLSVLTAVAASSNTQYSWRRALILEYEGLPAGAVVAYDGADLEKLRKTTLDIIQKRTGKRPNIADETQAGEYYLDSIAILPPFRGKGLGKALLHAFCEKIFEQGYSRIGLIVDKENPQADRLYRSQGFEPVGERDFFGHAMWHLQKQSPYDIRQRVSRADFISEFQRRVYLALLDIPAGKTITYSALARQVGCSSALAVGQALKRNPFAPEVPCHRVLSADGSMGGYLGRREGEALELKRQLLKKEAEKSN